jgi:hypothetical protein
MANIVFVGDSYCASLDPKTYEFNRHQQFQDYKDYPGHPAIVATHYGADLYCYGYSGKSWWYSYRRFQEALQNNSTRLANTLAIVFFHTDSSRMNTSNQELTSLHSPQHFDQSPKKDPLDFELADASRSWFKYLYDTQFQEWAQRQYFMELKRQYSEVKTIHFHCFEYSVEYSDLLPGMVYTTPLFTISNGEPGEKKTVGDARANHFNAHNNNELAQTIIRAIDRYEPGKHTIALEGFDLVDE